MREFKEEWWEGHGVRRETLTGVWESASSKIRCCLDIDHGDMGHGT